VDLDSTNGTVVGDRPDPIPPNTPVRLADGDVVKVGAWTTITLVAPDQSP
jgi:pSer/pThr/pTyr-binding forkhead associated (FHA) protein